MTPEQTVRLINILTKMRTAAGLSVNEVARRAKVDPGTVSRIEQGMIPTPKAESLKAIGTVLGIRPIDLFTIVGWLPEDELPTLDTYLRARYPGFPDHAIDAIEHYTAALAEKYGVSLDDGQSRVPTPVSTDSSGSHVNQADTPPWLPDEYDVLISVTDEGVAVRISDRATKIITHEQNDLYDVWEGLTFAARVAGSNAGPGATDPIKED